MFGCFRCKTSVELVETDVYSVMRIQAINSFSYLQVHLQSFSFSRLSPHQALVLRALHFLQDIDSQSNPGMHPH